MLRIFICFFLMGCSVFKMDKWSTSRAKDIKAKDYRELTALDYIDHLKSFEKIYTQQYRKKIVKLGPRHKRYLNQAINKISNNNELFFRNDEKAVFYFINSKVPFHFSLPGKKFFFSTALIEKYIKNEAMLYCLLAYEYIRSEKNIYKKTIIIPTGTLESKKILSLLRLDTADKVEIHKWAYYLLKRVGVDSDMYLTWLQVKNRNSLDFSAQLGDIQSISREESLYKAFVIEYEKSDERKNINRHRGSSKRFYAFLSELKR